MNEYPLSGQIFKYLSKNLDVIIFHEKFDDIWKVDFVNTSIFLSYTILREKNMWTFSKDHIFEGDILYKRSIHEYIWSYPLISFRIVIHILLISQFVGWIANKNRGKMEFNQFSQICIENSLYEKEILSKKKAVSHGLLIVSEIIGKRLWGVIRQKEKHWIGKVIIIIIISEKRNS